MPQLNKKHFAHRSRHECDSVLAKRPFLEINKRAWIEITVFLLSMSAIGLEFYPAIILILILLFKSYIRNRHEFIVQLTLFVGAYGLYDSNTLVIKQQHIFYTRAISVFNDSPGVFLRTRFIRADPQNAPLSLSRLLLYSINRI